MRTTLPALLITCLLTLAAHAAETPKEAVGFFGAATGTVKTAEPDGSSFTFTITKADPDPEKSAVKDAAPVIGKVLTLGTRMPRDKDKKPQPHPDDVAFIKSLKPGDTATVKIFAVRSDPSILRVTGPGEVTHAAK